MTAPLDLTPTHRPDQGLWLPQAPRAAYEYSEFLDDTEDKLLALIKGAADRSLASPELAIGITDFATRYHLSPERANLLRPLEGLLAGKRVLELGAGCGALTRYLGELGAQVTAVEGSRRRAGIIAARCHDLPAVQVVCDRIEDFLRDLPDDERFDAVLLVGVLEYSPRYIDAPDSVQALLQRVAARVAPGGAAIIAIENQLGLKYFAGAAEDHVGVPLHGIQDAYGPRNVVTFGRGELAARLAQAGLGQVAAYLPLPDYKLPVSVLAPALEQVALGMFDPTALVRQAVQADPQLPPRPLFSLERALGPVVRNGLLAQVANSLLLVAMREAAAQSSVLAWHYSARRKAGYAKATRFVRDGDRVTVTRAALYPQAPAVGGAVRQQLADETYQPGTLWSDALGAIVTRPQWTLDQVAAWARRWQDALTAELQVAPDAALLPGTALDLLPQNMIVAADGTAGFIDREWTAATPLPRGYVLFRGLVNSLFALTAFAPPADARYCAAGPLLADLLAALGPAATLETFQDYAARESALNAEVYRPDRALDYQRDVAARVFPQLLDLTAQAALQRRLADGAAATAVLQIEHHAALDARQQFEAAAALRLKEISALEGQLAAQVHAARDAQAQWQQALAAQTQTAAEQAAERLAQLHAANDTRQQLAALAQLRLDRIAALEAELAAGRHAAADTQGQYEGLIAALRTQLAAQTETHATLQRNHAAALAGHSTAAQAAEALLAAVQAEAALLQDQWTAQQAAHDQSTQALAAARAEITTLDGRLAVQTIQHDTLQAAHADLNSLWLEGKARNAALETAQIKLDNALADERTLRASAERRLADRAAELAALRQSTSWRITTPLRFAARSARALAARLTFARPSPATTLAPQAVTPGAVRYSIDYLNIKGDRLYMFGWAFHAGAPVVAAELLVQSGTRQLSFEGTYATARPDVAEALQTPAAGPSGFRLGCKLPALRAEGATLRFRLADGRAADFPVSTIPQRAAAPNHQDRRRHRLRRGLRLVRRGQLLSLLKKSIAVARRRRDLAGDVTQAGFATLVTAIRTGKPVALPLDHQGAAFLRQLSAWHNGRVPVTILFDHQLGGGTNHYRHALLADPAYQHRAVLLFTYDVASSQPVALLRPLGNRASGETDWLRVPAPGLELALEQLGGFAIAELFLNNIYSFEAPIALLRAILRLRKQATAAQLRIAAHDHFGICPSYTLLNHQDAFCHVPKNLSVCRNCLSQHKGEFTWLMEVPDIGLWRTVWQHALQAADEILVFSHSTKALYQRAYRRLPDAKFKIVPHSIGHVQAAPVAVDHGAPLQIGIVGHISVLKGAQVVRSLCEAIVASGANARVTIIGTLQIDYRSPVLTVTGTYVPQDLPRLIVQHGVNLAFFSSICPETFSYVTAELMQLQLPILAFDVGAPAERLADYPQGRVVPLAEQHAVLDHLLRFHADLAADAARAATSASVSDLDEFRQRAAQKSTQGGGQPQG